MKKGKIAGIGTGVAALLVTAAVLVSVNLNKTATLTLIPSTQTVTDGENVSLTVGTVKQKQFRRGIVGLTMDVAYDASRLTYVDIYSIAGDDFPAEANEGTPGIVSILMFPNSKDSLGKLPAVTGGGIFILRFTVKPNAPAGEAAFTPSDCNFADYKNDDSGFELVAISGSPVSITVK